jgi:hypothetical protein
LDKLDRYTCLKESDVLIPTEGIDDSSDDEEDEEEEDEESEDGQTGDDQTLDIVKKGDISEDGVPDKIILGQGSANDMTVELTQEEKVGSCEYGGCSLICVVRMYFVRKLMHLWALLKKVHDLRKTSSAPRYPVRLWHCSTHVLVSTPSEINYC